MSISISNHDNYFQLFQNFLPNISENSFELLFGKIIHKSLVLDKNILLLNQTNRNPNKLHCFCNWHDDIIFSTDSFNAFKMNHEHKINLASKTCQILPNIDNIQEIFKIIFNSYQKDLLLVFNLQGSGATVPQHFHTQIFLNLNRDPNFTLLLQNLQIIYLVPIKIKKYPLYDFPSHIFRISVIQTPLSGIKFWIPQNELTRFSFLDLSNEFTRIIQFFLSQITLNNHQKQNFSFNFLYSGINNSETKHKDFEFNIIFRDPQHEQNFQQSNLPSHTSHTTHTNWGWLESIGAIRNQDILYRNSINSLDKFLYHIFQNQIIIK